jgi:hypothetical protein
VDVDDNAPMCDTKAGAMSWWKTGNDGSGPEYPLPKGCFISEPGDVGVVDKVEGGFIHLSRLTYYDTHDKRGPLVHDHKRVTGVWSVYLSRKKDDDGKCQPLWDVYTDG